MNGINGAAPPFIVHIIQTALAKNNETKEPPMYSPDSKIVLNKIFSEGLANPLVRPKDFTERINPCGFCVRATKSGSIKLDVIYDYACHFVKQLPKDQGKDGDTLIFFLYGHASR